MKEIIGGLLVIIGAMVFIWYIWKALFGKCSYCGSKDIVPDSGLFFYCNNCRRKS